MCKQVEVGQVKVHKQQTAKGLLSLLSPRSWASSQPRHTSVAGTSPLIQQPIKYATHTSSGHEQQGTRLQT